MYINNEDLEFLIKLENELGCDENWSDRVKQLWKLNEKLIKQRESGNKKAKGSYCREKKNR